MLRYVLFSLTFATTLLVADDTTLDDSSSPPIDNPTPIEEPTPEPPAPIITETPPSEEPVVSPSTYVEPTPFTSKYPFFERSPPAVEAKLSYFFFTSSQMGDIYSNGGFEVYLSGSYPIYRCLHVYTGLGYLQAWGESQNANEHTTVFIVPVDLALKSLFTLNKFSQYFITFGPRYFYVHQHNHTSYIDGSIGRNGVGCFVNSGFNFFPLAHFYVDLFTEYAYQPTHFSSSRENVFGGDVQVSTLSFGLGLGYSF